MKWANVEVDGQVWSALIEDGQACLLEEGCLSRTLGDLAGAEDKARSGRRVKLEDVRYLPPVIRPGKILAIGLNYAAHVAESVSFISNDAPEVQKWFNKQTTATNAHGADVHLPKVSSQLDYEAELVVIIGKRARHVPPDRAMEIIAGFACGCDYSVRDWQKASPTMIMGKGFDTHAPFGPYLVTPDEVGELDGLGIRAYVNDDLRQEATLGQMIHTIGNQIAHLTSAFTLEPGDVIFTGTPAGVGAGRTPPAWLKVGDRVRIEIDRVGTLENRVVAEPGDTRIG
ncbi:fumarylacetoacetate hydrolase family protein [Henriciella litoralis]|uniref:fumarylacetoacetate hydrolase family protein n=1 Tax=Henriciella litoralis TaxID=568102 RepID=UPI000A04C88F|nr:fumarylacetoacetate hydrolase family protein [Henriciella litoralis]